MKKSKLFIVGLVLSIIGALGCIGIVINGTFNTIAGCLIFLIAGVLLIVLDTLKNKHSVNKEQDRVQHSQEASQVNQKPEAGKSHVKVFKVAGVTFENRQDHLKKLLADKLSGKHLDISLNEYDYQGHKAISVVVNGKEIGNLHTDDTNLIFEDTSRVVGIKDLYINDFEDENGKTIYYAKIKLIFKNKQQK